MIGLLDHIPEEGETVKEGNILFSIRKMDANRIETVYMRIDAEAPQLSTKGHEL